jgi:hypothetical protein
MAVRAQARQNKWTVVPAKAGIHIPEAVVMGPQHKRVYARLRRAMRGDEEDEDQLLSALSAAAAPARKKPMSLPTARKRTPRLASATARSTEWQ